MPNPYKESHDKLIAAIGTSDQYTADWREIAAGMSKVVVATGFDARYQTICDAIRTKLGASATEAISIRAATKSSTLAVGIDAATGNGRACGQDTAAPVPVPVIREAESVDIVVA